MKLAPSDVSRRRIVTSLMAGGVAVGSGLAAGSPAHAAGDTRRPPRSGTSTSPGAVTNVKDAGYGAAGDGTTDDTAAIQAAIDDTLDGGTVFFPAGTYLVQSSPVTSSRAARASAWSARALGCRS